MKLYEIVERHKKLELLVDSEELTVDDVADTFESIEGEFNDKAVSIIHVVENIDSDIKAIDDEIKRLQARKKSATNKKNSIRDYLKSNMQASGITKIQCPLFNITLAKGRDSVVINNADLIPDDYVSVDVVTTPDKRKILAALKSGEVVDGCELTKTDESLRIS